MLCITVTSGLYCGDGSIVKGLRWPAILPARNSARPRLPARNALPQVFPLPLIVVHPTVPLPCVGWKSRLGPEEPHHRRLEYGRFQPAVYILET